ncbi:uncharacterized protein LOC100302464 [Acyrthosiphon pisum]|uniref:SANTA domain-containing protein n=1 Tax=Acyrthosiphon pisum TaxID=7029 RepID=C4WWH1_ACYPI|nr:uncharacterized protein LOC100302464 [Acyrthosiphon pisum]BAH72241.1 hypothetical protein [Acyrthosiphon pisum]|eukprot:NP_001156681.1 uncharacterized protein LOC100302464 [Acyrthosiphon pisum]
MFIVENNQGSFEEHTIKKNSTNVPDCCGFKINIGNNNGALYSADKLGLLKKEDIMCLKSWTIIKGKTSGLFKIRGKLCDKKNSITGKMHDAGFIKKTIKKDLIQTTNGKYYLITPPAKPKNELNKKFYTFWMKAGGFPQKFNKL